MNINSTAPSQQQKNSENMNEAFVALYPEIKKIAHAQLKQIQPGKTITATVLVNECYLKLQNKIKLIISSEKHFFCLVAKCMKQFLIDEIRSKSRNKRSAELKTSLISQIVGAQNVNIKLIEIIHAVDQLETIDSELAELVNLHCFGGFTFTELSQILSASKRQLIRKWQVAKTMIISLMDEVITHE
jgi:RNA polymerase sigma factor (TIGR02999 family)